MKALVTGAGGFCGRTLAGHLRALGHDVLTMGTHDLGPGHIPLSSVLDAPAIRAALERHRPDSLFHLAGTLGNAAPEVMEAVNVGYAHTLLAALEDIGLSRCRVLLFGSAAEYGPVPEAGLPIDEEIPAAPTTEYGKSKLRQTLLGLEAHARGLSAVMLRPFNLLGPGLSPQLAPGRFARQVADIARKAQPPIVSTGNLGGTRDFIDVVDVVEQVTQLAEHPSAPGRIINICTGRETPVRLALMELLRLSGVSAEVQEAAPPPGAGHALRNVGSPRLLHSLLGPRDYRPLEASLRAMLDHELGAATWTHPA